MTDKAQSKSEGKPKLGNIWKWLDKGYLLEVGEQMRIPVEEMRKYPRNNWKKGIGDQEFIEARIESAIRHLEKIKAAFDKGLLKEAKDWETGCHETAACAANLMMVFYCVFGDIDEVGKDDK